MELFPVYRDMYRIMNVVYCHTECYFSQHLFKGIEF